MSSRTGANRLPGPRSSPARARGRGRASGRAAARPSVPVQEVRAGAADLAEQVRERRQRDDVAADGDATPDIEVHTGPFGSLGDQGRLADAGVATDQEVDGTPTRGVCEGAFEQGELVGSSDEVGVVGAVRHGALIMTPRSRPRRGAGCCRGPVAQLAPCRRRPMGRAHWSVRRGGRVRPSPPCRRGTRRRWCSRAVRGGGPRRQRSCTFRCSTRRRPHPGRGGASGRGGRPVRVGC